MSTKWKATTIAKPVVKESAKAVSRTKIDEARTTISTGLSPRSAQKQHAEIIELSDSDSIGGAPDDDEELGDDEQLDLQIAAEAKNGESVDIEMGNSGDASDGEQTSEPTFGELLRGNSTVDVSAAVAAQAAASHSRHELQQRHAGLLSNNSLATVLNQALRTDDNELLESCLQTADNKIVENTVSRMDSALAMKLLDKLAARMHRRPGRALSLMMWMKLTMIAHGGSLITHPDRVARLGELQRVLEERAKGLPVLLQLKGKLEMLDAQLKLRKTVRNAAAGRGQYDEQDASSEEEDEDSEEAQVVYVEGQESTGKALTNGVGSSRQAVDDEDDFPVTNGVIADSDEESDEDFGEEGDEEIADVESMDEDEVDHDDDEDEEDDMSEAEDAGPPTKVRRTSARPSQKK